MTLPPGCADGGSFYNWQNVTPFGIDDARVFGGIHYRFDQVAGAKLARAVAKDVYENNLRKLRGLGQRSRRRLVLEPADLKAAAVEAGLQARLTVVARGGPFRPD